MYRPFCISVLLFLSSASLAGICQNWMPAGSIGTLSSHGASKVSGIAVSRVYADRLYHVNESNKGASFYVSDTDGSGVHEVMVNGFDAVELEDLGIGSCHGRQSCLYIGDIGGTPEKRRTIRIAVIGEVDKFSSAVTPFSVITAQYPNHSHHAEAMAVHPNGDIFIITNEFDYDSRRARSAQVFRLSKDRQESKKSLKLLEYIGQIDLPYILSNYNYSDHIVTGFDISPDGKGFAIMTYNSILEVNIDLSQESIANTRNWELLVDLNRVTTHAPSHQGAITYDPSGESLVFLGGNNSGMRSSDIYEMSCDK